MLTLSSPVAVPSRVHAKYQLTKTLPFWIKRYVLQHKEAKLAPLYHFESVEVAPAEAREK